MCENFTFGGLCPINSHHILTVLTWCFDTFVKTIDMPKSLDKLQPETTRQKTGRLLIQIFTVGKHLFHHTAAINSDSFQIKVKEEEAGG